MLAYLVEVGSQFEQTRAVPDELLEDPQALPAINLPSAADDNPAEYPAPFPQISHFQQSLPPHPAFA